MPTIDRQLLSKQYKASLENPILGFFGSYRFLSNFWSCAVVHDELLWPSSEHAYMASKTHDPILKLEILHAKTSGEAKRIGRSLVLRKDWEDVKFSIMYQILKSKFSDLNPELKENLIATRNRYLEETNTWGDVIWGVDARTLEGLNALGQILMLIRSELNGFVL